MKRQLTDTAVRNATHKPDGKAYKLTDGGGMYLFVGRSAKSWRYNYSFGGKRNTYTIGTYPEISLKEARRLHEEARERLAHGIDPNIHKLVMKAAQGKADDCFEVVAREWFVKFSEGKGWSDDYKHRVIHGLEKDVFPWLGKRRMVDIEPPEVLQVLRKIDSRKVGETRDRAKQLISRVFCYAVAHGKAQRDPVADLRGAFPTRQVKHFAAVTEPKEAGELMRAIYGYDGDFVTCCALRLLPLVFTRPGELRKASWAEFDLDAARWNIPAERMKKRRPHSVPLSRQAVAILRDLYPLTGHRPYIFPGVRSPRSSCMSENTVNAALRKLGYSSEEMTGHGFRSMASSLLHELGFDSRVIETQLAHKDSNEIRGIYNRSEYWGDRVAMMQAWADYLDGLRNGAQILPFRKADSRA